MDYRTKAQRGNVMLILKMKGSTSSRSGKWFLRLPEKHAAPRTSWYQPRPVAAVTYRTYNHRSVLVPATKSVVISYGCKGKPILKTQVAASLFFLHD